MPDTTNTNSDFVSPVKLLTGSADDFFSDEILGEVEDDTTMEKKQLFEYETPSKTSNELLRFQNTQTFLRREIHKNCTFNIRYNAGK